VRPILVIAALLVAVPVHAQPKDMAELFPADSIVYVEVNQPGAVGKDLTAFLKGSVLVKSVSPWSKLRESIVGPDQSNGALSGVISSIFGSQMLKEAARFKGMAAALTGFDKHGEPQYVGILLTGGSSLPVSVLKTYVSRHPDLRKFATVEGVDLYQESTTLYNDDPQAPGVPAPPQNVPFGPIFGHDSNVFVVGSNKELIAAVIRRLKGKAKDKSEGLAGKQSFKEAAEQQREAPGIFLFAEGPALQQRLIAMRRQFAPPEAFEAVALRRLLPLGSVRTLSARFEIKDSELVVNGSLKLDAKSPAPLADLLEGANLTLADLNAVAKEAPLGLTLHLPAGEQRSARFLALLDALVKSSGSLGPTASEIVEELEQKKILAASTIAQIDRLTVAMPPSPIGPKTSASMPAILLHTESEQAAAALESALPAVLELLGAEKSQPVVEHIYGVTIRSLDSRTVPLGATLHFGRHGKSFAIGPDRKLVAACLAADPVRGAASTSEVADAFKSADRPGAFGLWNWAESFRSNRLDAKGRTGGSISGVSRAVPIELDDGNRYRGGLQEVSMPRELFEPLAGMPPLTATIGRRQDEIRFEVRQRDPNRLRIKAIDRWFNWYAAVSSGGGRPWDPLLTEAPEMGIPAVPPPPPIFLPQFAP